MQRQLQDWSWNPPNVIQCARCNCSHWFHFKCVKLRKHVLGGCMHQHWGRMTGSHWALGYRMTGSHWALGYRMTGSHWALARVKWQGVTEPSGRMTGGSLERGVTHPYGTGAWPICVYGDYPSSWLNWDRALDRKDPICTYQPTVNTLPYRRVTLLSCKEATKRQDKDVQYGHGEWNVNSQNVNFLNLK